MGERGQMLVEQGKIVKNLIQRLKSMRNLVIRAIKGDRKGGRVGGGQ